jgi:hypothetical protein
MPLRHQGRSYLVQLSVPHPPKDRRPTRLWLRLVGRWGGLPVACRQIRPVAGVNRAGGHPNSAEAIKSWLETERSLTPPLHSTGSIRKGTKRIKSTRKT